MHWRHQHDGKGNPVKDGIESKALRCWARRTMSKNQTAEAIAVDALRAIANPTKLIAAVRNLMKELHRIGANEEAQRLAWFESETDAYPVGDVRQRWNATVLSKKDDEMKVYCTEAAGALENDLRHILGVLGNQ